MTTQQIRSEIQKVLEQVPDTVLEDVLNYLKQLQDKSPEQIEMSRHLGQILKEDAHLLEKLAQ